MRNILYYILGCFVLYYIILYFSYNYAIVRNNDTHGYVTTADWLEANDTRNFANPVQFSCKFGRRDNTCKPCSVQL